MAADHTAAASGSEVTRRSEHRPAGPETPDRFDDDDDEPPANKRSRRTIIVSTASILAGLSLAALIFLGRVNGQRYLLVCSADHVSAQQGRSFPPWGSRALPGPEWQPISLPANAECKPRQTESSAELEQWYLEILEDRANTLLTARNLLETIPAKAADGAVGPNPIDTAAEQLDQALLLTRAPERRKQRTDIDRLLGDVEYWRAALKLRIAGATLVDAAKQFEVAAAKPPRHAADAAAWGSFLRRLAEELHAGPAGVQATAPVQPGDPHAGVPVGTALPIEPAAGPLAGSDASGTAPSGPRWSEPANAGERGPDAGVAPGGVLL